MNLKVSISILYTSMRAHLGMCVACVAGGKLSPKGTRLQDRPASRTEWRSKKLDVCRECRLCVLTKVQHIYVVICLYIYVDVTKNVFTTQHAWQTNPVAPAPTATMLQPTRYAHSSHRQ